MLHKIWCCLRLNILNFKIFVIVIPEKTMQYLVFCLKLALFFIFISFFLTLGCYFAHHYRYNSKMLLAAIDENHHGTYDFIYLPIDFKASELLYPMKYLVAVILLI